MTATARSLSSHGERAALSGVGSSGSKLEEVRGRSEDYPERKGSQGVINRPDTECLLGGSISMIISMIIRVLENYSK